MKGVKWSTACLTLLGLCVLSLLTSSDASALKYSISEIPLTVPENIIASPNFYTTDYGLKMVVSNDIDFNVIPYQYVFSSTLDQFDSCNVYAIVNSSSHKLPYVYGLSEDEALVRWSFTGFKILPKWDIRSCMLSQPLDYSKSRVQLQLNYGFNIPLQETGKFTDNYPYRFSYDAMYLSGTTKNSETGVEYNNKFDLLRSLFGYNDYNLNVNQDGENLPTEIYEVWLPLGPESHDVDPIISNDMPIEFSGEFLIDFDNNNLPELDSSNTVFELQTFAFNGQSSRLYNSNCSYSITPESDDGYLISLKYICSTNTPFFSEEQADPLTPWFDPEHEILRFQLHFKPAWVDNGQSSNEVFQYLFESSYAVTFNDYTPTSVDWTSPPTGGNLSRVPGSVNDHGLFGDNSDDVNWFSSLFSLFTFTFINPFLPIFSMFSDQSTCANIPTIAGMLHSEETQVCPWFSSQTRQIGTSVLSIFSVMLVFGFAMKWLGSRSGKLIDGDPQND